ncbi:hypothetical protein [Streptococcus pyogenes]|uniref:hypothetical protein n=1 Tax=Streptococcus pyogenes TaxID=1314 RepID=UPI0010A0EB6F|nr:hypothetical protein [Streptococcus pyogenes]VHH49302.1 Uncharacterised protein [Streptococcus pyogenes]VHH50019.1 Uncharacterised protein [Streptococcus pyogenes]HEQ9407550.1 hypothetical protein [Streptococcus pyogenes]
MTIKYKLDKLFVALLFLCISLSIGNFAKAAEGESISEDSVSLTTVSASDGLDEDEDEDENRRIGRKAGKADFYNGEWKKDRLSATPPSGINREGQSEYWDGYEEGYDSSREKAYPILTAIEKTFQWFWRFIVEIF